VVATPTSSPSASKALDYAPFFSFLNAKHHLLEAMTKHRVLQPSELRRQGGWGRGSRELKGKCALGPFLSILVIECKHKCFNVNLCPWMNKVQIMSKGMFLKP
jgi:hypothetical protein